MSTDLINSIQREYAKHYTEERKRLGNSFLAALYNLRLPGEGLSQEDKKRLSYVVWLFFEFSSNYGDNRAPGVSFSDGFMIHNNMIGYGVKDERGMYHPGEEEWWNSKDFGAFQRNYQHLCELIESCIEGEQYWNFQRENIEWFDKKISRLLRFSVQLQFKQPVFLVPGQDGSVKPAEIPPNVCPPLIPITSTTGVNPPPDDCVSVYIDLPRTGGAWLYEQSEDGTIPFDQFNPVIVHTIERDMPPSDRILRQAYLELLETINGQLSFKRCQAGPTKRHPACQNIFRVTSQRGPKRLWCSHTCRRRVYEHTKKARNRTKNGRN